MTFYRYNIAFDSVFYRDAKSIEAVHRASKSPVKHTKAFIYSLKDLSRYFSKDWDLVENNDNYLPDSEEYDSRWHYVRRCLMQVKRLSTQSHDQKYANIILCEEDFVLNIYSEEAFMRLKTIVPSENFYSTTTKSSVEVLKEVQTRFGKQCQLVMISSNTETLDVANKLLLPFWPIRCNEDFDKLYNYQQDYWLAKQEEEEEKEEEEKEEEEKEEEEVHQSLSEDPSRKSLRQQMEHLQKNAAKLVQELAEAKAQSQAETGVKGGSRAEHLTKALAQAKIEARELYEASKTLKRRGWQ